jgi:CRISPR/Cas system CSM-associated protein Csm3 (group 7 of RAMP superfamily)
MIITMIKAEIGADAGWAVGTSDAAALGLDRELLTDPNGRPWVPPSSLAGSLRAHLADHDSDERLMGSKPPSEGMQRPSGLPPQLIPSALWLLGTRARRADAIDEYTEGIEGAGADAGGQAASGDRLSAPRTGVVANTAVDPVRKAAQPKSLRYSRVVDEPAVIELYALLEGELSAADRDLLASWRPQIGRDRTRGGGVAWLRAVGYRAYDLDRADDLQDWLKAAGPGRFAALTPIPVTAAPDSPLLEAEFRIASALHIGTGSRRGNNAAVRTRGGQPLVPATTWKGLFRARAGYIIRSCWGEDTACASQSGCGLCPLCSLFGSTTSRGRISFRDSTVTAPSLRERNHVAIDRISGGGQDKLLFTDDVVTSGTVKLAIFALGPVTDWEHNLLLHVMRDIHDGLIGVGGGTQRGQGTLQLTDAARPALTGLRPMPAQRSDEEDAP